jgi:hypothetical protein
MAKPMLVTLPFTLLLLDFWPLQRFEPKKSAPEISTEVEEPLSANKRKGKSNRKQTPESGQAAQAMVKEEKPAAHKYQWALVRPLIMEKIPLLALAALSCIVTYFVQKKGGAVVSFAGIPLGVRIANGFVSYIIYIRKTIWPSDLAVFYPHPQFLPLWQVLGAVLFLGAVTFAVIRAAKRFPYLAVGWLWFAGTLVPVIGIVQVGGQAMADRYTYIPLIGLFVMAAWGIPELLEKWQPAHPPRKEPLFALPALILACLLIVTWTQVGYWRNSIALYDHSLKVTNPSDIILFNRGAAYDSLGNHRQAISDYDRAIKMKPNTLMPIITGVLPMPTSATTGRRFRIMRGLSRSIPNMLMLITTGAQPMPNLATTGRRFRITTSPLGSILNMRGPIITGALPTGRLAIRGRRFQITTGPSRSIPNTLMAIITGVLPMPTSATTGRRFRITTGPSRSILNMQRRIITGVWPMSGLAITGRRFRIMTGQSRSTQNMPTPIVTGALPMAYLAITGRRFRIMTGPSRSTPNMRMHLITGV